MRKKLLPRPKKGEKPAAKALKPALITPNTKKSSTVQPKPDGPTDIVVDSTVRRIEQLQREQNDGDLGEARKIWKHEAGCHHPLKAGTAMYRDKTIFGGAVRARKFENQTKENCINFPRLSHLRACNASF